jgi:Flp pilus assembly protein TadG
MVETALILPVLLLILLGIMEFGRILGGYMELQSAARDVTRYAAIHNEVDEDSDIIPLVKERVILLDQEKFTVDTVDFNRETSVDKKDQWVTVTLNYSMDLMTPLFETVLAGDHIVLDSKMVMRVE